MQVTREDLNPCTVQLTVVADAEEVKAGYDKALKQMSKNVKIPGFRPGHVPKAMIEKMIDPSALSEETAENVVRSTFKKAVTEQQLEPDPGTRPSVDLKKLDVEKGECEYSVKVPLPPVVELGDYKGLPVEKQPAEVTEEEVDYQIDELRRSRHTRENVTDRGAQEGDVAVVNVKIEGEEGDGRNFMTVVGKTFPQMDQVLSGMKVEEMKVVDLTFPENFQEKDWAGKPFKCQVTLNSVSAVTLPELDDSFAQSFKTENVDELRTRIREAIGRAKDGMAKEVMRDQLMDRLLEKSKIEVSDNMWEQIANQRLYETEQEQREQGKTLEQHAAENGMTVEALVEAWRGRAKTEVIRALMIRTIFQQEKMQLTNQELNQELFAMAQEYGMKPEELLDALRKNNMLDEVQYRAISRKVSEFLIENADVKEVATSGKA